MHSWALKGPITCFYLEVLLMVMNDFMRVLLWNFKVRERGRLVIYRLPQAKHIGILSCKTPLKKEYKIIEILTWYFICDTTFEHKCTHRSIFNFKAVRWDSLTFSGIVQQWSGIESVFYFFWGGWCVGSSLCMSRVKWCNKWGFLSDGLIIGLSWCFLEVNNNKFWSEAASLILLITGGCLLWRN